MIRLALVCSLIGLLVEAAPFYPFVDSTRYPYTGPAIPNADPGDQTINGNGVGYPRIKEPPAVVPPEGSVVTNNINVIALSYLPTGMTVHFQTPFGIGADPMIMWGTSADCIKNKTSGSTETYDRTPSCSLCDPTQCSQFFHNVPVNDLEPDTTYYYVIPGGNGTVASPVQKFTTAKAAGTEGEFTVGVYVDMGYTNAGTTRQQLINEVANGMAFAWSGGDMSYADDWYEAMAVCVNSSVRCYNGTQSKLPDGERDPAYSLPVPSNETDNIAGPYGGDSSTFYETNWDIWQNWMNNVTQYVPNMVMPGNHEAACVEGDAPQGQVTALLVYDEYPGTETKTNVSYGTCPPSQRNFTAFAHRFHMAGEKTGGLSNFWYSFDYGLAHFVSFDSETDFVDSPTVPLFARIPKGSSESYPLPNQTRPPDSGPMGFIDGDPTVNANYEQYQWLKKDLEAVNRTKTPWIFAMSHRPMHSAGLADYEPAVIAAFEDLLIDNGVDVYFSGHVHLYERMFPIGKNNTIDYASVMNNNDTYKMNNGVSMTHVISGQAGDIENLSIPTAHPAAWNAFLDHTHFGFTRLTVSNATHSKIEFVHGTDGSVIDTCYFLKTD